MLPRIGLWNTRLMVPIGCQYDERGPRNHLTAADLVQLYADVEGFKTLDSTRRDQFYAHMNTFTNQPEFQALIEEEGKRLGVSAGERYQVWTGMRHISKGGNYILNRSGKYRVTNTVGGIIRIPYQNAGGTYMRSYSWAEFIWEGTASSGQDAAFNKASIEMFRIPIRWALTSFKNN
jgi:hypothetical protein